MCFGSCNTMDCIYRSKRVEGEGGWGVEGGPFGLKVAVFCFHCVIKTDVIHM